MPDTKTLGIEGKAYVGAAGSTPTDVYPDVTDVTLTVTNNKAKYATRGQKRNNNRTTTQDLQISFTVLKDFANAQFELLHAAAMAGTPIAVKLIDKTSGYGWDADWVLDAKEGQPLEGFDTVEFTGDFTSDNRALTEINPA